jgi:hypothetical protein
MNNYFINFLTVEQIKAEYRRLAMLHHPDRGGDTATMQEINQQYTAALKRCDGQQSKDDAGNDHTYRYNAVREQEVMDALHAILRIKMDAKIWLIGCWIWIVGDTRPVKDQLKALGCMWHAKRLAWYWRTAEQGKWRSHSPLGLDGLAEKYGVRGFTARQTNTEVAA